MLKYGFFDSIKGDRKYNSRDVATLFDGIILDGIYAQIGQKFSINPKTPIETTEDKMKITVGTGQAWLNHVKVINTTVMELDITPSISETRYDAIILEINEEKRNADIFVKENVKVKTVNGEVVTTFDLQSGQLTDTEFIHQNLLAVIRVEMGSDQIKISDISSKIGFDKPTGIPYVTSPVATFPADETLKQWVAQWNEFYNASNTAFNAAQTQRATEFTNAQNERATTFSNFMTSSDNAFNAAQTQRATEFTNAQNERESQFETFKTAYNALIQSIETWLNSTDTDWDTWFNATKDAWDTWFEAIQAELPTKVSQLENDSGYITAKSPALTGTPTAPTPDANTNNTQIATTAYVKTLISNLINGAPETLDTLKEIADALGENDDVIQALETAITKKANASDVTNLSNRVSNVETNLSNKANASDVNGKVSKTGDTMTGRLNAHGGISLNDSSTQKSCNFIVGMDSFSENGLLHWEDFQTLANRIKNAIGGSIGQGVYLPLTGGTLSGPLVATNGIYLKLNDQNVQGGITPTYVAVGNVDELRYYISNGVSQFSQFITSSPYNFIGAIEKTIPLQLDEGAIIIVRLLHTSSLIAHAKIFLPPILKGVNAGPTIFNLGTIGSWPSNITVTNNVYNSTDINYKLYVKSTNSAANIVIQLIKFKLRTNF